jgi:hypothetical protein
VALERLEPSRYGCWIVVQVYFENSHNLCHFMILGCESENLVRESLLSVALHGRSRRRTVECLAPSNMINALRR